jgi:hypothetical protein
MTCEEETILLQRETFREFPLGLFPHNYGAWGEYHYWPIEGYRGAWYEPTNSVYWAYPRWMVMESDGDHWMVQHGFSEDSRPLLVTGDPDWKDYSVTCRLQPLSLMGPCGLVVRYRDSRSFLSFASAWRGAR